MVLITGKITKARTLRYATLVSKIIEKAILNLLGKILDTKYLMETNVDDYVSTNNNIQNLLDWDINLFKDLSH